MTEEVLNNVLEPDHDHDHKLNTTFLGDGRQRSLVEGEPNGFSDARLKTEQNGASWPRVEGGEAPAAKSPSPPLACLQDQFLAPFACTSPRKEKSRRLTRTTTELLNETSGHACSR